MMRSEQEKKREPRTTARQKAHSAGPEQQQHDSEDLLRQANEQLVVAALAAKEAAQREQALREQLQAQNEKLRQQNEALLVAYQETAKAQARADELRQQLESVLQQMPSGVIIAEAGTGKIILANEQAEQFWRPAAPPVTVEEYREAARHQNGRHYEAGEWPWSALRTGEIVTSEEIDFLRPDGSRRTLSVSAVAIRDRDRRIIATAAIFHDVTERRELDRLKDQFITVAAHELKTPVAIMKGCSELLLRRADVAAATQGRRMLEAIDRGSDRIASIVQDLLDISKLHAGRLDLTREPIDLPAMVADIVEGMGVTKEKHRIRLVKAEPVVVPGDRHRLEQVVAHLIDNAAKYSPDGGDIEVAVTLSDHEAVVSVTDHGIGIPKDKQARIFQRFYSAHTNTPYDYGGMGVGLYISQEVVSRHGGRMWFESEEGKGSTFYFTLPLT